jgi:hypothetical protein
MKRLVVIDGKSVFYRGYYAMPGLSMADGTPTGGVYGFVSLAIELIKKLEPDYVAVAWDKRDWSEIENLEKGGPIAIADYFIINDGSLEQLHQRIDAATHDAHFCKSPEQC